MLLITENGCEEWKYITADYPEKIYVTSDIKIQIKNDFKESEFKAIIFSFVLINGGEYKVEWDENIEWIDGKIPTLSTEGSDFITLYSVDKKQWIGYISKF